MNSGATANPRILDWEGVLNARDTGGIPAANGRVRRGGLVRSGVLNGLTPDGLAALTAHGVRTVIDVRAADEVADHWDRYPLRDHPVVGYRNLSFTAGSDQAMRDQVRAVYGAAQSREEINRLDLDNHRAGIAAIVGAIADAPPGGVLIHCHAGKDRTGLVVALTLSAIGVGDEDVADDYALSQLVLDELVKEWFAYMGATASEQRRLRMLADPSREAMLGTLKHLHQKYGDAAAYLLGAGLSKEQLERLRARLLATA